MRTTEIWNFNFCFYRPYLFCKPLWQKELIKIITMLTFKTSMLNKNQHFCVCGWGKNSLIKNAFRTDSVVSWPQVLFISVKLSSTMYYHISAQKDRQGPTWYIQKRLRTAGACTAHCQTFVKAFVRQGDLGNFPAHTRRFSGGRKEHTH